MTPHDRYDPTLHGEREHPPTQKFLVALYTVATAVAVIGVVSWLQTLIQ